MNSQSGINGTTDCYSRQRTEKSEVIKGKEKEKDFTVARDNIREFQFGLGRWGTFLFLLLLNTTVTLILISCTKDQCSVSQFPKLPNQLKAYVDFQAYVIFLGWILFQVIVDFCCSGKTVEGKPLCNGQRLKYQIKGFKIVLVNVIVLLGLNMYGVRLDMLVDKILAFYFSALFTSIVISVILYMKSFSHNLSSSQISSQTPSGDILHDIFTGREINPRFYSLDLKSFLFRLSQLGMVTLNFCLLLQELQKPTDERSPLIIFCPIFEIFHAIEHFYFEEADLMNRTFSSDGLGFKLVYGCMTFVPFIVILPTLYNIIHRTPYNEAFIIILFFVWLTGYSMYRLSKSEKLTFYWQPNNEDFAEMEIIQCENGENLLVSGWWGWVRHPNYLGLIIYSAASGMLAGFDSLLPYSASIFFAIYFAHRVYYEDKRSRVKYGKAWDLYCEKVKYRLLKFIY